VATGDSGYCDALFTLWTDLGGKSLMLTGFLIGVIATTSVASGVFFLKFWSETRDVLFLAFGLAFLIEGFNRAAFLMLARPNEGSPWIYVVRLLAFLLILTAIVNKNYGRLSR
jgi:uncharacterized membrane protein HdeD (DUF308 family)